MHHGSVRCLSSLCLSENHLPWHFAWMVFETLVDASSSIAVLDLSENNVSNNIDMLLFYYTDVIINRLIEDFTPQIRGWLSHIKWKHSSITEPSGTYNLLKSLKELNLRYVLTFLFMPQRSLLSY